MRRTVAWLVILSLLLPACASRNVPPIGADGQAFKPESDERALWAKAEKEEEALLKKAKVYDDPMLAEYLPRIGDRLTPYQVHEAGGPGFKFGVIGQTANAILGLGLALTAMAAINGYGRDLERDADNGGMENLVRAGYDPKEAPKVFALLRSESKDRGSLETFFFGSHPKLTERIETTEGLLKTKYAEAAAAPTTVRDTEDFQLRMRSVVRENAYEDIRAGRFPVAQRQLDRVLAITPKDSIAHTYYGDLHRLQAQRAREADRKAEHARLALASYEKAVELDETAPEPHRQLGFLYYQQKDNARAKAAFEKYLALKPTAPDAKRIKEYLVELDR